jgi:hypothetical protein
VYLTTLSQLHQLHTVELCNRSCCSFMNVSRWATICNWTWLHVSAILTVYIFVITLCLGCCSILNGNRWVMSSDESLQRGTWYWWQASNPTEQQQGIEWEEFDGINHVTANRVICVRIYWYWSSMQLLRNTHNEYLHNHSITIPWTHVSAR